MLEQRDSLEKRIHDFFADGSLLPFFRGVSLCFRDPRLVRLDAKATPTADSCTDESNRQLHCQRQR